MLFGLSTQIYRNVGVFGSLSIALFLYSWHVWNDKYCFFSMLRYIHHSILICSWKFDMYIYIHINMNLIMQVDSCLSLNPGAKYPVWWVHMYLYVWAGKRPISRKVFAPTCGPWRRSATNAGVWATSRPAKLSLKFSSCQPISLLCNLACTHKIAQILLWYEGNYV